MANLTISNPNAAKLSIGEQSTVKNYFIQEKASNTWTAYNSDFKCFQEFCAYREVGSLPAEPQTVAAYVAYLDSERGFKASTINRRLSAIAYFHEQGEHKDPTKAQSIKRMMKGFRRSKKGESKKQAAAVPLDLVEEICKGLAEKKDPMSIRARALLIVAFLGGFRRSELANLKWEDLSPSENGYTALVRFSKTDQEGEGKIKALPYRANPYACPVRALNDLRDINPHDYIFTSIRKGGKVSGKQLTGHSVNEIITRFVGNTFSSHSFRAGFVTHAFKIGISEREISNQTGHKHIPTLRGYGRRETAFQDNAVTKM